LGKGRQPNSNEKSEEGKPKKTDRRWISPIQYPKSDIIYGQPLIIKSTIALKSRCQKYMMELVWNFYTSMALDIFWYRINSWSRTGIGGHNTIPRLGMELELM